MIYEISKHRFPLAVSCLCIVVGWINPCGSNYIYNNVPVGSMISSLFRTLASLFPFIWLYHSKLHFKNITELVRQVLESNPGLDIKKWDEIASVLNLSFYQRGIWNTPYFFFDGKIVEIAFKNNILGPYLEGKFNSITDTDKLQSARCYLQSVNAQFELSLKEDFPRLSSAFELPRDNHKSKLYLYPTHWISLCTFCYLQGAILFWVLTLFKKSHSSFSSVIYEQYMALMCCSCFYNTMYPQMDILQAIKFLAIITKVSPGKEPDKWDQVAKYMNQYLIEVYGSGSENIFFDGKHCLDCYSTRLEPLSVGKNTKCYGALKEIVDTVQCKVE
ncbi:hypothetical protein ZYGR_0DI00110 [Zygosaccharomyces rouxii]|uniref:Uncharacterized protein n=1 Tax=Zygosaccharomyces rouxii TaxID=4956 RepID=A0A1Q3ALL4_ZYGRO|nr:hypothetical protein ZYGR_0DI00110 [Zygosaccharomyces rouxii]